MIAAWGGNNAVKGEQYQQCSTYHKFGNSACHRNLIRESALVDFLVPKILNVALSAESFNRLRTEVRRQLAARMESAPADLAASRARLDRLDAEVKAAARSLNRAPDDLYDDLAEDLRETKAERDKAAAALEAAARRGPRTDADLDKLTAEALEGLETLSQRLQSTDKRLARGALQRIVKRIDLSFTHTKTAKMVRSNFDRGVVNFSTCNIESVDWPEAT